MELVYDFLEGKCDYHSFVKQLRTNDDIFDWLQSLYKEEMLKDKAFRCENALWRANGNVKDAINNLHCGISVYDKNDIYNFLYWFLSYAFPQKTINRIKV